MANARTRFDTLANDLQQHEATQTMQYGKHCLLIDGEPFLMLYKDGVAFRLSGRELAEAMAVEGAEPFDPLTPDQPSPARGGWVRLPAAQFARWDEFAPAAMYWVRLAQTRNVSWQPAAPLAPAADDAPASTPERLAERTAATLKSGFAFDLAERKD